MTIAAKTTLSVIVTPKSTLSIYLHWVILPQAVDNRPCQIFEQSAYLRQRSHANQPNKTKLNQLEFTEKLAVKMGITHSEAQRFLACTKEMVYEVTASGDSVQWSGFGTFSTSHRQARLGVNPRTLAKITIPELRTSKFVAGEAWKRAVALKN